MTVVSNIGTETPVRAVTVSVDKCCRYLVDINQDPHNLFEHKSYHVMIITHYVISPAISKPSVSSSRISMRGWRPCVERRHHQHTHHGPPPPEASEGRINTGVTLGLGLGTTTSHTLPSHGRHHGHQADRRQGEGEEGGPEGGVQLRPEARGETWLGGVQSFRLEPRHQAVPGQNWDELA